DEIAPLDCQEVSERHKDRDTEGVAKAAGPAENRQGDQDGVGNDGGSQVNYNHVRSLLVARSSNTCANRLAASGRASDWLRSCMYVRSSCFSNSRRSC